MRIPSKPPNGFLRYGHPHTRGLIHCVPLFEQAGTDDGNVLNVQRASYHDYSASRVHGIPVLNNAGDTTGPRWQMIGGQSQIRFYRRLSGGQNDVRRADFGASSVFVPTANSFSYVLGLTKYDDGYDANFGSGAFGIAVEGSRCGAHIPWNDGTVIFQYGSTSFAVTYPGLTLSSFSTTPISLAVGMHVWAFTVGPRGMEIWMDGQLLGSTAAFPTRAANAAHFQWGQNFTSSDNCGIWFGYMYNRQLSPDVIRGLAIDPWAMFQQPVKRSALWMGVAGVAALGLGNTPFVYLSNSTLELELNGVGGGWTDATVDLTNEDIACDYGIRSSKSSQRLADIGHLSFGLRNDARNSGSTQGWYSPYNAARRTGFNLGIRVRYTHVYSGVSYRWMGRLNVIDAVPGKFEEQVAHCVAFDWMDDASRALVKLPIQQSQRLDQIFTSLIGNVPLAPDIVSTQTSHDTPVLTLDDVPTNTYVKSVLDDLARSELGFIGQKRDSVNGQTVFFEPRRVREINRALLITLNDTQFEKLDISGSRDDIINKFRGTTHPRRVDSGANTVVAVLDLTGQSVLSPGETRQFSLNYTDPTTRNAPIGAINQITPVAGTDIILSAASTGGTSLSTQLSIAASFWGGFVDLTVTNNGPTAGYFTKVQVRGNGVYSVSPNTVENSTGAADNPSEIDFKFQSDQAFGVNAVKYLLDLHSTSIAQIRAIRFLANQSDTLMLAALQGDISTRIALSETVTGVSAQFFINAVLLEFTETGLLYCTWLLAPAEQTRTYWQVGVVGASEIGVTTYIGM